MNQEKYLNMTWEEQAKEQEREANVRKSPPAPGLDDPAIAKNAVDTIIYGIHNICIEKAGGGIPIFKPDLMGELRGFVLKTLKGI